MMKENGSLIIIKIKYDIVYSYINMIRLKFLLLY